MFLGGVLVECVGEVLEALLVLSSLLLWSGFGGHFLVSLGLDLL